MLNTPSLSQVFERRVATSSDAVALLDGSRVETYASLNCRANRFARYLRRRGVSAEKRVIVCAERSIDLVALLLGVIKAGGAYVPIDSSLPPARMSAIAASADAAVLVTQSHRAAFAGFAGETIVIDEHQQHIAREDATDLGGAATPSQLCAVLFTSGSSGTPKGILIPMSAVMHLLFGMLRQFPYQSNETVLLHRSYMTIGSLTEYFGPLLVGARSTILIGGESRDPAAIWARLIAHRVSRMFVSPLLARALVDYGTRHGLQSRDLLLTGMGGQPVERAIVADWRRVFPTSELTIGYGTTETGYLSFFDAATPCRDDEPMPAGRPFDSTTIRLLDPDTMVEVGQGEVGEICAAGPGLARGYLRNPGLTAERFVPDPWSSAPGAVLYRTGDIGRWRPDGLLEVCGRRDRQVKIRGFRVELDEVEAAIRRVMPGAICAACVESDRDGQQTLTAYIEASEAAVSDLRRLLRQVVPEYMVPSIVIPVSSMPLTTSGKPDRAAIVAVEPQARDVTVMTDVVERP